MEKNPKSGWGPSFFKVLVLDYTTRLSLPPVFVRNYGEFLDGSAKLRANSGDMWNVEMKEQIVDDGRKCLCFVGGGWTKFVKDLELQFGEFVFFVFNGSTFDVSVFGTDCCERPISAKMVESEADEAESTVVIQKRGRGRPKKIKGRGGRPRNNVVFISHDDDDFQV